MEDEADITDLQKTLLRETASSIGRLRELLGTDSEQVLRMERVLDMQTTQALSPGRPLREWQNDQLTRAAAANAEVCGDDLCARQLLVVESLTTALEVLRAHYSVSD